MNYLDPITNRNGRYDVICKGIDYTGFYELTPDRKKVVSCKRGKFLSNKPNERGTVHYSLYKDGKCTSIKHDWIVASLFVHNSNPKLYTSVAHHDLDETNGDASNLFWTTHEHAVRRARRKS